MHTGNMYMYMLACTYMNVLIACDFVTISNIATYSQTLYYIHTRVGYIYVHVYFNRIPF